MMVVTGFSPQGLELYGYNFLNSFAERWPLNVPLAAYVENDVKLKRAHPISAWLCPGLTQFIARHKGIPAHCGYKTKDYLYKWDAVKFCRQLFYPQHAVSALQDGQILVWLDGDVVTFDMVPDDFIEGLLGEYDLCYLGREPNHSEIGFWAVRVNPRTRVFLFKMADCYSSDKVFSLAEWHSAFVFDHCRKSVGVFSRNLTPGGKNHVWFQSPLRHYMDHLKGNRKLAGRSKERAA